LATSLLGPVVWRNQLVLSHKSLKAVGPSFS
jgi:hypothetical protein